MTTDRDGAQAPDPGLTIGDLARRTRVAATTLRMWESRYGFPRARRLSSGHRRYDEAEVDAVKTVLRHKAAGVGLAAAVAAVAQRTEHPAPSVYSELRRLHPHVSPQTLHKQTLTALTHAVEDECCARAEKPWIFAAFQKERFYRQSQERWKDLAATAAGAWVLAEFQDPASPRYPVEVALPPEAQLRREWILVCLAQDRPCVVSAWELPGQSGVADGDRLFETLWTADGSAVLDAARCLTTTLASLGHQVDDVASVLDDPGFVSGVELRDTTGLFNRIVGYVDRSYW